jgi:hypothetical protein
MNLKRDRMKEFSKLTQSEIYALSDEEFKAVSPFEKKGCYDCGNLKHALSWWCGSDEAKEYRGTLIPDCIKCKFWKPDWDSIDDKYKTEENGYVKPIEKVNQVALNTSVKWHERLLKYFT